MTVSNAYNHPTAVGGTAPAGPGHGGRTGATAARARAGRALKRGRSDVLGSCSPRPLPYAFGDPGTVSFLHGVTAATAEAGLALQLIPAAAETAERLVRDAAVDGLIAHSPPTVTRPSRRPCAAGCPTVVSGGPSTAGADCITVDTRPPPRTPPATSSAWATARSAS